MKISGLIILLALSSILFSCTNMSVVLDSFRDKNQSKENKYKGVQIISLSDPEKAPFKINCILADEKIKKSKYDRNIVLQTFIDEEGKIAEIAVLKSLNPRCDTLAIEAIKKSQFSKVNYDGKNIKYQFFTSFTFAGKDTIFPVVSGCSGTMFSGILQHQIKKDEKAFDLPETLFKVIPHYPIIARKKSIQGVVVVTSVVDENGDVIDATIFKSIPLLDQSTLEAAYLCKYKPVWHNGRRVKVRVNIPFYYKIKSDSHWW